MNKKKNLANAPFNITEIDDQGLFCGYGSIFGVRDNHNDIVMPGAFARSLRERYGQSRNEDHPVKLLWQHKPEEPIGVFTDMREDDTGLYVCGKLLLDVQRGKEAYSLLKSGAITGLSIGYQPVLSEYDDDTGARLLYDVDLWEVSLVTFPANESARVTAVKAGDACSAGDEEKPDIPSTIREFEHFLRDAGFSRKQAKYIACNGFEDAPHAPPSLDEMVELDRALDRALGVISF